MRYAQLKHNDTVDGEGVCVSLWMQGCSIRCQGCHNSSIWYFDGGIEIDRDELCKHIDDALDKHGVHRNFSVLGGEPLALQNIANTCYIINHVRILHPEIKIFLWTGYVLDDLHSDLVDQIKKDVDVIIDGPYIENLRDITLHLRGSSNQRILYRGRDF